MKQIRVADLSPAFRANESNSQMLYERCVADSAIDEAFLHRAGCLDISAFGPKWDFSKSFALDADIHLCATKKNQSIAWFSLLNPEIPASLGTLFHFPCVDHSPLAPLLSSCLVPRLLGGSKKQVSLYVLAANRLEEKGYKLVLSGQVAFERGGPSIGGPKGNHGTMVVNVHLPRYDYLSDYLKKYF